MFGLKRLGLTFLIVICCFSLFACSGGGGDGATGGVGIFQASGSVSADGGVIEVTDANSPIVGTKVEVPQDALDSDELVAITISYADEIPGPVEDGVVSTSKAIILSKDSEYKFKQPVTVTIPYSDEQLEEGDIPAVFYWDYIYNQYVSVGVKNIDTVNKTITFTTVHFSNFVTLAIKGLAKALVETDTGFRPDVDGFFHPNFGAFDSPSGCCLGMTNYSLWYYSSKKATDGEGLYFKYREGNLSRWEDDAIARELISRAYLTSSQFWAKLWLLSGYVVGDKNTGLLLITTMKITGSPQTLILHGLGILEGGQFGHAVTVYKYQAGKFYIYDNNFPGEEVTFDWIPLDIGGFSNYTKAASLPSAISKVGFEAFSTAFDTGDFELFYSGAESGWPNSRFQTINIISPSLDESNTALVSSPDNIVISGKVTGGERAGQYLIYNVNGTNGLMGRCITLDNDGGFSFTISHLNLPSNYVMLMSTTDQWDALNRKPSGYTGFKAITIKVEGQSFFTNLGFETGDFSGWNHETHTWDNSMPGSFTPEKSAIESEGTDPIDNAIQKVYTGDYSARVNNYDSDYHISSISQTATVPNVSNPQLRFYWSAVLEDPQHDPSDQPYVDIMVNDDTAGVVLYSKHFYSNDPSYSGWRSVTYGFEEWKTIPWQVVSVNVNSAKGHQITVKVTAADCSLGAHGGYVYLDGDE